MSFLNINQPVLRIGYSAEGARPTHFAGIRSYHGSFRSRTGLPFGQLAEKLLDEVYEKIHVETSK